MSPLLNVLIGLALMYLTLALIVTAVQEAIAGILQWRAHTLAQNVREMLNAAATPAPGSALALLRQLYAGRKLPAEPPANALATSVDKLVLAHPLVSPTGQLPSYIASPKFALALIDSVSKLTPQVQGAFSRFEAGVAALPAGRLKTALTSMTVDAAGDVEQLKKALAGWFDDVMDRVSGIYKRWAAIASFVIGLLLALFLVADTIGMLRQLGNDPHFATGVVKAAAAATPGAPSQTAIAALALNAHPSYWFIGWCDHFHAHLRSLVGCLLTAIALSLGAPFWFDLLGTLINVRSAGAVPDRADAAGQGTAST